MKLYNVLNAEQLSESLAIFYILFINNITYFIFMLIGLFWLGLVRLG